MDPYKVLGINNDASDEEIKKAYKNLARKYHPDKGGTVDKFREINEAYTQITKGIDPIQEFPELSELFKMFGMFSGFGGFDLNSMDGLSAFEVISGHCMKGPTIATNLKLKLEQIEQGGKFTVKYVRKVPSGKTQQTITQTPFGVICIDLPEEITKEFIVEIVVPPCYDTRKKLVLINKAVADNLPPGDLEVLIKIENHSLFTRVNGSLDLEILLDITLKEALTGFYREINLLNSDECLKIEVESIVNPYDSKVLTGYGMNSINSNGDLIIKFKIIFPIIISSEIKDIIKTLEL